MATASKRVICPRCGYGVNVTPAAKVTCSCGLVHDPDITYLKARLAPVTMKPTTTAPPRRNP